MIRINVVHVMHRSLIKAFDKLSFSVEPIMKLNKIISANGSGLAMWRYSVIRQPEPLLIKVTKVDDMFCSWALFVSRN